MQLAFGSSQDGVEQAPVGRRKKPSLQAVQVLALALGQVLQLASLQAVQAVVVPVVVALKNPGLHAVHLSTPVVVQVKQLVSQVPQLAATALGVVTAGMKYFPSSQVAQMPAVPEAAVAAVHVLQAHVAVQIWFPLAGWAKVGLQVRQTVADVQVRQLASHLKQLVEPVAVSLKYPGLQASHLSAPVVQAVQPSLQGRHSVLPVFL